MFLMIGINDGQETLYYDKLVYFSHLGQAVHVTVFVTYVQLLLFFIPTFKWRKRYYVQLPNGEVFELNEEVGLRVARGADVEITEADLYSSGRSSGYSNGGGDNYTGGSTAGVYQCPYCGYPIVNDFDFCPKCGRKLR